MHWFIHCPSRQKKECPRLGGEPEIAASCAYLILHVAAPHQMQKVLGVFMTGYQHRRDRVILQRDPSPVYRDARQSGTCGEKWFLPAIANHIHTGNNYAADRGVSGSGTVRWPRSDGMMEHEAVRWGAARGGAQIYNYIKSEDLYKAGDLE